MHLQISTKQIIIEEYRESDDIILDERDIKFIQERINEKKPKLKIAIIPTGERSYRLQASSYIGVIQLPSGIRIQINPKIPEIELLYILRYIFDVKLLDYDETIFKRGGSYLDIIALLFRKELEEIINEGLFKRYINERDNLNFLKGKLVIKDQIKFNYINKQRFFCDYDDLNYDNIENQTVLYALFLLSQMVDDRDLRLEMLGLTEILRSEINLRKVTIEEANRIVLTRLNDYYEKILDLSKLIIENIFIEDLTSGEVLSFSFLIDMNTVFEKFIFKAIKEIYPELEVIPQDKLGGLLRPDDITIKPDMLIKESKNDKILLIADTKYKKRTPNDDYYQIIAYSLAHQTKGLLVYPKWDENIEKDYEVQNLQNQDIQIFTRAINISKKPDTKHFEDYIASVKKELGEKISRIIEIQKLVVAEGKK